LLLLLVGEVVYPLCDSKEVFIPCVIKWRCLSISCMIQMRCSSLVDLKGIVFISSDFKIGVFYSKLLLFLYVIGLFILSDWANLFFKRLTIGRMVFLFKRVSIFSSLLYFIIYRNNFLIETLNFGKNFKVLIFINQTNSPLLVLSIWEHFTTRF